MNASRRACSSVSLGRALLIALVALLVAAAPGSAAYPGENGKIAFVRGGDIWTINPDGSSEERVTSSPWADSAPSWSPDGRYLAFIRASEVTFSDQPVSSSDLLVMDSRSGRVTTVVSGGDGPNYSPSWSPDGKEIALARNYPAWDLSATVWIVRRNGSRLRQITPDYSLDWKVAWSPAGGALAVLSGSEGTGLGLLDLDDGQRRAVGGLSPWEAPGDGEYSLSWAPDGRRLAFARWRYADHAECFQEEQANCWERQDVAIIGVPGGNERILTSHVGFDGNPAWSPDGSQIAFESDRAGMRQVFVMNDDGTDVRQVTTLGGSEPDWQPLVRQQGPPAHAPGPPPGKGPR